MTEAHRLADSISRMDTFTEYQRGEILEAAAELRRLDSVNAQLLEALKDSATSLETISRIAGKAAYMGDDGERIPTYMGHHDEVRSYAASRAAVSRAAIAATGETK